MWPLGEGPPNLPSHGDGADGTRCDQREHGHESLDEAGANI